MPRWLGPAGALPCLVMTLFGAPRARRTVRGNRKTRGGPRRLELTRTLLTGQATTPPAPLRPCSPCTGSIRT
jgi:hypothetical protein